MTGEDWQRWQGVRLRAEGCKPQRHPLYPACQQWAPPHPFATLRVTSPTPPPLPAPCRPRRRPGPEAGRLAQAAGPVGPELRGRGRRRSGALQGRGSARRGVGRRGCARARRGFRRRRRRGFTRIPPRTHVLRTWIGALSRRCGESQVHIAQIKSYSFCQCTFIRACSIPASKCTDGGLGGFHWGRGRSGAARRRVPRGAGKQKAPGGIWTQSAKRSAPVHRISTPTLGRPEEGRRAEVRADALGPRRGCPGLRRQAKTRAPTGCAEVA